MCHPPGWGLLCPLSDAMVTAADIQARIDALDQEAAKVSVVKSTQFNDQHTVFRDLREIAEHRARLVAQLAALRGKTRTRFAATSKGLG